MAGYWNLFLLLLSFKCVLSSMPGGWKNLKLDDSNVQAIASSAITQIDLESDSSYRHKLVELKKASVQVVAGLKYHLEFVAGETSCEKDSETPLESCSVSDDKLQQCEIEFVTQPWLKGVAVGKPDCTPISPPAPTQQTLGQASDVDLQSEDSVRIAQFAVDGINQRSNNLKRFVLQEIRSSNRQTVAGYKWDMQLLLGTSTCRNKPENKGKSLEDCPVDGGESSLCRVTVFEQSWMDDSLSLQTFKCAPFTQQIAVQKTVKDNEVNPMKDVDQQFEQFKLQYNKTYPTGEEKHRFQIFQDNMKKVAQLQKTEKGDAQYGPTKFADLSEEEFRKYSVGSRWDVSVADTMTKADIPNGEAPPEGFDWRDHNAVTEVKNQGTCGSCWAFSTTGNIEGQWAIKKKRLLSLSEQELVDCDHVDHGCNGGLPSNAYNAIEKLGGLESENDYPYEGKGEKCNFDRSEVSVYINDSVSISSDETDMAKWLYQNGPISIGINANAMQFYMGGVSHPWSFLCNPDSLDHGVLIVGYGVKNGWFRKTPYWIVKNSWGESWGENGYYLVYRGAGVCGLNKMPTSAVVN